MKKKQIVWALTSVLAFSLLAACGGGNDKEIIVAASPAPHAEILEEVSKQLEKDGYKLTIKEFTDYIQPNMVVEDGSIDANYFQHITYMNDFNAENKTHLISVANVHFEPLGLYPGKTKSLEELAEGAEIAVPNDPTNEARALLLLQAQGLIKLKDDAGLQATPNDIVENPKNLTFRELEAAMLPRSLEDADMAVINGNYALGSNLKLADAVAVESSDPASEQAKAYVNVLTIKEGSENKETVKALVKALKSDEMKKFMEEKYQGAVVPMD